MRKLLLSLLGGLLALPTFADVGDVFTFTYENQTLNYTVIDETAKTVCTSSGTGIGFSRPGNSVSGDLIIPGTVKNGGTEYSVVAIGGGSFIANEELTSVIIPNTVTEISWSAFLFCHKLASVEFPQTSLLYINSDAFRECALTTVNIPNSVRVISAQAFYSCPNLTSVKLSEALTEIGANAFGKCESISVVENPSATPIKATSDVFATSVYGQATLYVPSGSATSYEHVMPWELFYDIKEKDFSIVATVGVDNGEAEYFNLQGMRVVNPTPGQIYIIRQNGRAYKSIMK